MCWSDGSLDRVVGQLIMAINSTPSLRGTRIRTFLKLDMVIKKIDRIK